MREAVTPPLPRTTLDMLSCVSRNAIARSVPLGLTGPVRANRERSRVAVAGGAATRSARMAMVSVREGPRARLHDLFDYWSREQRKVQRAELVRSVQGDGCRVSVIARQRPLSWDQQPPHALLTQARPGVLDSGLSRPPRPSPSPAAHAWRGSRPFRWDKGTAPARTAGRRPGA